MPACGALLLVALASGTAAAQQSNKDRATYKWVDEKGVVHYGDQLPPDAARRERAVLNRQGVEVKRLEAQRTPEQIAAEQRRAEQLAQQKQRDSFLLTTYASERDIVALRDQRLGQLADQRNATAASLATLNERLTELQGRAMRFRPYNEAPGAKPMPNQLAEDIVRTLNDIRTLRATLEARNAEERTVRSQFESDLQRYRELVATRTRG